MIKTVDRLVGETSIALFTKRYEIAERIIPESKKKKILNK